MPGKYLIVVAGPTAVGKTATAIALARHFGTEIISADSRQCYREMSIGTAKPSAEELATVPHHFINSHSITDALNAADYEQLALDYLEAVFSKHDTAIVCGGTGLYIKALCEGLDEMPGVDKETELQVRRDFEEKGMAWLQQQVAEKMPGFYARAEQQNPVRLMRALSFYRCHGQPITDYRTGRKKQRPFHIIKTALELPREWLYQRIDHRVDLMMEEGLLKEVEGLFPHRHLKNLQTVGYRELFEYLEGNLDLQAAVALIKQHTRNYAKRQMTWFRKDEEFTLFAPESTGHLLEFIYQKTKRL